MDKLRKYGLPVALVALWLDTIISAFHNGFRIKDLQTAFGLGISAFLLIYVFLRMARGRLSPLLRWMLSASVILLLLIQLYLVSVAAGFGTASAVLFLSLLAVGDIFEDAIKWWERIASPVIRRNVAAAFFVAVGTGIILVMVYVVDWKMITTNWDVTLAIVFLPMLFIGWWALTKWQGRKL